ncbi:Hypothetical_protein [Hexamita inflata]|uniref:Hypothetical_protein n=1 Tax=Hexamita inflata TaxID=28002 RepID=A0AA86THD0_9EUKA|nr:Hypothetical protein HINF_LOCUS6197 [Hexamita inflata]CAI9918579.1 Hypothetical protein HINF_LOCUS6224 [Hexamita inflata]
MDPASLSYSDFEVIADYSNKPIAKLIQKVNLEPDFKKEFLRQPIIKTFIPNRFVNPHINKFSIQEVDNLVFKGIPSGYIQKDVVKSEKNSNSEVLYGCVLKANEHVEDTIKTAPKRYDIQIIKPKKNSNQTPKIQISLKADDKVIIPHLYDLQKWQEIVEQKMQMIIMMKNQPRFVKQQIQQIRNIYSKQPLHRELSEAPEKEYLLSSLPHFFRLTPSFVNSIQRSNEDIEIIFQAISELNPFENISYVKNQYPTSPKELTLEIFKQQIQQFVKPGDYEGVCNIFDTYNEKNMQTKTQIDFQEILQFSKQEIVTILGAHYLVSYTVKQYLSLYSALSHPESESFPLEISSFDSRSISLMVGNEVIPFIDWRVHWNTVTDFVKCHLQGHAYQSLDVLWILGGPKSGKTATMYLVSMFMTYFVRYLRPQCYQLVFCKSITRIISLDCVKCPQKDVTVDQTTLFLTMDLQSNIKSHLLNSTVNSLSQQCQLFLQSNCSHIKHARKSSVLLRYKLG